MLHIHWGAVVHERVVPQGFGIISWRIGHFPREDSMKTAVGMLRQMHVEGTRGGVGYSRQTVAREKEPLCLERTRVEAYESQEDIA